jgi:hypothetical protein
MLAAALAPHHGIVSGARSFTTTSRATISKAVAITTIRRQFAPNVLLQVKNGLSIFSRAGLFIHCLADAQDAGDTRTANHQSISGFRSSRVSGNHVA